MDILTEAPPLSLEDQIDRDSDTRYELIDGKLVERNMGALADDFASQLFAILGFFIRDNKLGRFFYDTQYSCFGGKIRRPDFSFIVASRMMKNDIPRGRLKIPPDLAIEVLSPNDLAYEVGERVADYLKAGVKEIWLVNPELQTISIRCPGKSTIELDENGILRSDDLLPGFELRVGDILQ
jgi:Uma2 family endonuclease